MDLHFHVLFNSLTGANINGVTNFSSSAASAGNYPINTQSHAIHNAKPPLTSHSFRASLNFSGFLLTGDQTIPLPENIKTKTNKYS